MARSRIKAFRLLWAHIGLPIPVDAVLVQDFGQAPAAHTPRQAKSLEPEGFWNMIRIVKEVGTALSHHASSCWCRSLASDVSTLARSRLQRLDEEMITAFCTNGKTAILVDYSYHGLHGRQAI